MTLKTIYSFVPSKTNAFVFDHRNDAVTSRASSKKKNIRINYRRIVSCDHLLSIEIIGIKSQTKSKTRNVLTFNEKRCLLSRSLKHLFS